MRTYIQNNIHRLWKGEEAKQEFRYKRIIRVSSLKNRSVKKIFYNKELKMHFESPLTYYFDEIEVEEVLVQMDKKCRKAQDFIRRMNYKYDWLQIERDSNGKIIEVTNLEELRKNWFILKGRLLSDYKGDSVDYYLEKISNKFESDKHFRDIFNQYYEYGLIYTPIPDRHNTSWTIERSISLDSVEDSALTEVLTFEKQQEDIRIYNLEWKTDENAPINIIESKGKIEYSEINHSVKDADINIIFTYDNLIFNQWEFHIRQVE